MALWALLVQQLLIFTPETSERIENGTFTLKYTTHQQGELCGLHYSSDTAHQSGLHYSSDTAHQNAFPKKNAKKAHTFQPKCQQTQFRHYC
jgi:hypothetical protein